MAKTYLIISLALLPLISISQNKTFTWEDELCTFLGTYNSNAYTENQLQNTLKLWKGNHIGHISMDATGFSLADLKKINPDTLENQYQSAKEYLGTLDIVAVPYWQNFRKKKLAELNQEYHLKKITIQSYSNPAILKTDTTAPSCKKYSNALTEGGDKLIATWKDLVEEQCKHNGAPENLRKQFKDRYNSPQRMDYARLEVTTFGWWNCANAYITRTDNDYQKLEKEYKKLFLKNKTLQCDEP